MADIFSKEKRSEIMSKIRGKDTKVEVSFRKMLSCEAWPRGYRYRKHYRGITGSPDVVFPKYKLAIFVDGDFWHGYNFEEKRKKLPGSYWPAKIETNMLRDEKNTRDLKKLGWTVLRFWEHEVKKNPEKAIGKVMRILERKKMP